MSIQETHLETELMAIQGNFPIRLVMQTTEQKIDSYPGKAQGPNP